MRKEKSKGRGILRGMPPSKRSIIYRERERVEGNRPDGVVEFTYVRWMKC